MTDTQLWKEVKSRNKWRNINQYECDPTQVFTTPDVVRNEVDAILDNLSLQPNDTENPDVSSESLEGAGKMFIYMYFCPNLPPTGLENRLKVVLEYILMTLSPKDIILNLKRIGDQHQSQVAKNLFQKVQDLLNLQGQEIWENLTENGGLQTDFQTIGRIKNLKWH